ncbi:MAG: hypothetical protein DRM99_04320, partial [Thermoplasmata archaeon]
MPTELDLPKGFAIGDNIAIQQGDTIKYYQITNRDTIFYHYTFDSVSAGDNSGYVEISDLNPPTNMLYQIYKV